MAVTQTLQVSEVAGSVDSVNNSSKVRIIWQSKQTGDSHNDYTRAAEWWLCINGGQKTKQVNVTYTLPQNTTKTIMDVTIDVPHKEDGSGTVQVYTKMDTGISAGVVERYAECTLTTIPRASTISASTPINQVDAYCDIRWKPLSKDFRYKIRFVVGSYDYTTGAIHPNTLSEYKYDDLLFSYGWVSQFNVIPSDKDRASVSITLYTYSDSGCTNLVGSSKGTLTVKLNQNQDTKPSITMSLSPVAALTKITDAYLRGKSKVKATFSGSGKFGATISSYCLRVGSKTYTSSTAIEHTSDFLSDTGEITVTGTVTDSRGFTNSVNEKITVSEYNRPSVIPHKDNDYILCKRCKEDGTPNPKGEHLLIKIGRRYSKVISNGTQKNFCSLKYSYKTDAGTTYFDPVTILEESASSDYVSVIIPNVVSSITTAYDIRLIATDTSGESDIVTIVIPSDFVIFHIPSDINGHGITFGGYHDPTKYDVFDCKFDAEFNGVVKGNVLGLLGSSGNIPTNGDLNNEAYRKPGVYAIPTAEKKEDGVVVESIQNMPVPYPGLLRVYTSMGQTDLIDGKWLNLMQEYQCYDPSVPMFRRRVYNDDKYNWSYSEWTSESASSIITENGAEVWRIRTRKGSDIYDLKVSESGISYHKNNKVVWTK